MIHTVIFFNIFFAAILMLSLPSHAALKLLVLIPASGDYSYEEHKSVWSPAKSLMNSLASENGWDMDYSTNNADIENGKIKNYDVLFIVNHCAMSKDNCDNTRAQALLDWVKNGGGLVGCHFATFLCRGKDVGNEIWGTTYPSGGGLFGTNDDVVDVREANHPSTKDLPSNFKIKSEWYKWRDDPAKRGCTILLTVRDKKPGGYEFPDDHHPVSWCRDLGQGRSWYTSLGHYSTEYQNANFKKHIKGGIEWAANSGPATSANATVQTAVHLPAMISYRAGQIHIRYDGHYKLKNLSLSGKRIACISAGRPSSWSISDLAGSSANSIYIARLIMDDGTRQQATIVP